MLRLQGSAAFEPQNKTRHGRLRMGVSMGHSGRGYCAGAALLALVVSAGAAFAQDPAASFPNKPIRMVVGFAAGGGNDIFARLMPWKPSQPIT
jgi:hypothetical protein